MPTANISTMEQHQQQLQFYMDQQKRLQKQQEIQERLRQQSEQDAQAGGDHLLLREQAIGGQVCKQQLLG